MQLNQPSPFESNTIVIIKIHNSTVLDLVLGPLVLHCAMYSIVYPAPASNHQSTISACHLMQRLVSQCPIPT